jgi:hypothetical protein
MLPVKFPNACDLKHEHFKPTPLHQVCAYVEIAYRIAAFEVSNRSEFRGSDGYSPSINAAKSRQHPPRGSLSVTE